MAMVTLTPACKTNSTQTYSLNSNNENLRDVSFSTYLNASEEVFVRKLVHTSPAPELSLTDATQDNEYICLAMKEEEGEIGVFGAEKYFNGGMDETESPKSANPGTQKFQDKSEEEAVKEPVTKPKLHGGTPSIRSESSWNSQTGLLQSVVARNPSRRSKTNKVNTKSLLAAFGCKCSCVDKNSVDVNDQVGEISFSTSTCTAYGALNAKPGIKDQIQSRTDPRTSEEMQKQKSDKFGVGAGKETFVTLPKSVPGNLSVRTIQVQEQDVDPRKSLEVFGSPVFVRRSNSFTPEKRATTLTLDVNPRKEATEVSASPEVYPDTASDASSDLFEIESLTGKVNSYLTRQTSDANSGCPSPTTRYAPSEASIEWSVVTASAADYSSVISDYEELRPTIVADSAKVVSSAYNTKAKVSRAAPTRHRNGSLLGCKSQKAVRVAGDAHRINDRVHSDPRFITSSVSSIPVARLQAEKRLNMGFDSSKNGHYAFNSTLIPRSHTPHASHLLYIQ